MLSANRTPSDWIVDIKMLFCNVKRIFTHYLTNVTKIDILTFKFVTTVKCRSIYFSQSQRFDALSSCQSLSACTTTTGNQKLRICLLPLLVTSKVIVHIMTGHGKVEFRFRFHTFYIIWRRTAAISDNDGLQARATIFEGGALGKGACLSGYNHTFGKIINYSKV